MRQTACAWRFLPAMIGGGTWEGAHARHEAAGVRQPVRRCGRRVAARGARAAVAMPVIGFLSSQVAWTESGHAIAAFRQGWVKRAMSRGGTCDRIQVGRRQI